MKTVAILLVGLLVGSMAVAQSTAVTSTPRPTSGQSQDERAKDLARATELSVQVVRLFGEQRYAEAVPLAEQVIEIRRRLLDSDDSLRGQAFGNLAELLFELKKDNDAAKAFESELAVYRAHADQNAVVISFTLERLAVIQFNRRHYGEAAALLSESLIIREKAFGANDLRLADTLHALANVYQVNGEYDRADPLYVRALEIQEQSLGRAHPKTIEAMKDYACLSLKNFNVERGVPKEDPDQNRRALRARATCWLGGFKTDCGNRPHTKAEGVLNGKAVKLAVPSYPIAARAMRAQGRVIVAVLIDEDGDVIQARSVCGGNPDLATAAVTAARASRFTPTKIDNAPVQVPGVIIYNFVGR